MSQSPRDTLHIDVCLQADQDSGIVSVADLQKYSLQDIEPTLRSTKLWRVSSDPIVAAKKMSMAVKRKHRIQRKGVLTS